MSRRLRVLIVEDSEDDTLLLVRELRRGGYDPTFERVDTPAAMNAALEQHKWDIVIADYVMPHFSGPAALELLKEKGLDLPFIIVSGVIGEETAVAAMTAGAHDYIMKDKLARLIPATERELREAGMRQERKRAEEEKKELEAQLQQAQKLESLGTLAGGIAHDFNNLLMGIQGNVSLMVMDMDSKHPYYERLKNIEKQIRNGARLTSYILGYARKGRYEIKPVDLNQLVEEMCETFGRTRKQITIRRELADDLFPIEADSGQIEQVVLNLLVNAADAMPGRGDLFLQTMNVTHKDITGKLYKPKRGDYVVLTVSDTGMGMDKETMERVFDPFFTTKEMGRGTGLGLASAYGIIKGHGGYIDVESEKGQGTTFSIYLPASERKVEKAIKTAERFIKGTGAVLLVDDERVILEVGQDLLEAMGYRVLIARDGNEAIEVYRKNQHDIDFVLLDMIMPDMGGGETYDKMKESNPDVKVLLSSGYSIDGQATEILERGCDGFIQKPFTMEKLSQSIKEVLGKE